MNHNLVTKHIPDMPIPLYCTTMAVSLWLITVLLILDSARVVVSFTSPIPVRSQQGAALKGRCTLLLSTDQHNRQEGDIISDESFDHDYVLLEDRSEAMSSGSSELQEAYRKCSKTGDAVGEKVLIKFSDNTEAMEREVENTELISKEQTTEEEEDVIIKILDHNLEFEPTTAARDKETLEGDSASTETAPTKQSMIVMEKASQDLLSYINDKNTDLTGRNLRKAIRSMVRSIASIHASGLVWSDAKLGNFVVDSQEPQQANGNTESITVKAIDLESCAPPGSKPPTFTPSYCPPEFVPNLRACLKGQPERPQPVQYAFDIWSLGTVVYSMVTGHTFHQHNTDYEAVTEALATIEQEPIDLDPRLNHPDVDPLAKDFILQCLKVDPSERPSMEKLLEHQYLACSTDASGPSPSTSS